MRMMGKGQKRAGLLVTTPTGNELCRLQYQRFNQNYNYHNGQTVVIRGTAMGFIFCAHCSLKVHYKRCNAKRTGIYSAYLSPGGHEAYLFWPARILTSHSMSAGVFAPPYLIKPVFLTIDITIPFNRRLLILNTIFTFG